MPASFSIEQKVECLTRQVGEVREQLRAFLAVSDASLQSGLQEARKIIEYFVGRVLREEGLDDNIAEVPRRIGLVGPASRRSSPARPAGRRSHLSNEDG